MLLRGVEPPEVGTVRDRIMTRMFVMEQTQRSQEISALAMACAIGGGAGEKQATLNSVKSIIDNYFENSGFRLWSNDKRKEAKRKVDSDADILAKVDSLSKLKNIGVKK